MKILILALSLVTFGCVSKPVNVEKVIENSPASVSKDITFFTFDAACWDREQDQYVLYAEENFIIKSVSSSLIGISKMDRSDFLPTSCILEAKEKATDVPVKDEKVNFNCFLGDNIIEGKDYNFVEYLSETMVWLVNKSDGQNIVLPKSLCQFF